MPGSSKKRSASATEAESSNESQVDLGAAAAGAGEQVTERATNLGNQVRQRATEQVMSQKERVVDTLDTVALLLHQAGEHATEQDKAMLAQYVDKAADQVSRLSESLRDQDVTQLMDSTVQLARRQPMAFLGGALAIGFAGARFFRASAQQAQSQEQDQDASPPAVSGQDSSPSAGDIVAAGVATGDLPPYDIDQAVPAGTGIGTPLDDDLSLLTDQEPGLADFTAAYEAGIMEGDIPDPGLSGDSEALTDPEKP